MKKILVLLTALISLSAFAADPETLVVSFQKQKNPEDLKAASKTVADYLSQKIGKKIEVLVPTSYGSTAQGLISNKVHVAFMDSLPYLLASKEADLEILAVEKRNDRTDYDSLIVVKKDSPIKSLKDLKGKKMAFASQTSTSGYLFPFSRLVSEKLVKNPKELEKYFSQILYAGGYDKAMLAVANGQADAAAFSDYAFEGPKADLYGNAETRSQLRILARTKGVPTHLIAGNKTLSPELRAKITDALLTLAAEKPDLLASVYGASSLVKADTKHVEQTRQALVKTGLEPSSFVK